MRINLLRPNYSYANAAGCSLKRPLFTLVANASIAVWNATSPNKKAQAIAKATLHCLTTALLILPAGATWWIGRALTQLGTLRVNRDALRLVPPQNQPTEESVGTIDLRDLGKRGSRFGLQGPLDYLCANVVNQNAGLYPDAATRPGFYAKLSLYLKGIEKQLSEGSVPEEKQRAILRDLANAASLCSPTWMITASRLWQELTEGLPEGNAKLLQLIQKYKEDLILEFSQIQAGTQWHALSTVKQTVGEDLGLNSEIFDPYATPPGHGLFIFKMYVKWLFLNRYENANHLVSAIQTRINSKPYDQSYYDMLTNIVQAQGIFDASYVGDHFYEGEEMTLNRAGVILMLKQIEILS